MTRGDRWLRPFGSTGLRIGALGLGSWLTFGGPLDAEAVRRSVAAALDLGVTLFDTSDSYGRGEAERMLGAALRGVPRPSYVVSTKCFFPMSEAPNDRGLSRKHVVEACHASLERLGVEYIDLLQCHRFDPETPVAETVAAMSDLVRQGKILYWGVSQWSASQLAEALDAADRTGGVRPVSNQVRYHMLDRAPEREIIPFCEEREIAVLAYSPLAQGVLTGKYRGGMAPAGSRGATDGANDGVAFLLSPENLARVERVRPIARDLGLSLHHLALAWVLRHAGISAAIAGESRAGQLTELAPAVDTILDPETIGRIDIALEDRPAH